MAFRRSIIVLAAGILVAATIAAGERLTPPEDASSPGASGIALAPGVREARPEVDPCADPHLAPNWMPPTWNIQAAPEQCGALEIDNLAVLAPMGDDVQQWAFTAVAKYGLAPRLQLRWGLPGRILQNDSSGAPPLAGATDQSFGALYHFVDQKGWRPDLAVDYGFKIPTANPSKALGSGYADHVVTFIASRDIRQYHFDCNLAGVFAGGEPGFDRAVLSGVGLSRTFPHNLIGTIEAFGGSQPGTADRLGAVNLAGSWGIKPSLALNGGWIHSYTASSPRSQFMLGFIYTLRPGLHLGRVRGLF